MPAPTTTEKNSTKTSGTPQDDILNGGTDSGTVDGKSGSDIVAGGGGDDWVKGGSSSDRLVYRVADNTGTFDRYDGGSGVDTLVLEMSRADWMRDEVQADIAAFLLLLQAGNGTLNGEGFVFPSLNLEVRKIEALEVVVDGVALDPRDEAVIANDDAATSATEHSLITGDVVANDLVPDLVRGVELTAAVAQGQLTLLEDGRFEYDPGMEFDYLAQGETAPVSFGYRVTDADRDSDTARVDLTITGTNDAPIAYADTGSTDENATLLVDVLANDTDVDLSDTHTVVATSIRDGLGAVGIVSNQVEWTPGTDYDYLALGEEATVVIDYTESDNNAATADSDLTITVIGSNDTPIANPDSASTDENATLLLDVLANDTDVDLSDTHTVDQVTITSGLGAVAIVSNQVEWTPGTDYDYLALGEEATVVIDYTERDNNAATADSDLTITVVGANDKPVANTDQASTEENASVTVDVLANDTDVDLSDTHTVDQVSIANGLGSVAIVGNQVEWTPGTDYDYLAKDETATVMIDYTQSDNNGGEDVSSLAIEVVGVNDAPVVADALGSEASEQDPVYVIDLLAGASDVDNAAVLSVANLSEPTGKGGWTLSGNQLTIDPDHFDKLNNGDVAALNFTYQVRDEHGATVDQALSLTINGFTDAPSLEIVAGAGATVNALNLTITSQPADDERVALSFRDLAPGVRVFDAANNDVTAGLANFSGTAVFTVVMPPLQDTVNAITVAVSGIAEDGHVMGESAGVVPLDFDYTSIKETLVFSSVKQGIWASGDAPMVHFHEYLPLIGGVTTRWNPATELWEDTGTGTWTSGKFPVYSSVFDVDDIEAAVLAAPTETLRLAKAAFDWLVSEADRVWQAAKGAYNWAVTTADNIYSQLERDAQAVFDAAVSATSQATATVAKGAYDAAIWTAGAIRDGAIATFGWMGQWVTVEANKNYDAAAALAWTVYQNALNAANWTIEAVRTEAQKILDATKDAGKWVRDNAKLGAAEILKIAEKAYQDAKDGVIAVAKAGFDAAQKVVDDVKLAFDQTEGKTVVDLDAELFAEVGVKVDFVLDSGSVDTTVTYELDSVIQHNRSTDVLVITPQFTNKTTGKTVAFETISPNATFKIALLYEVGAKLDLFLDSNLIVSGQTIFDLSGAANGIEIDSTLSTGGLQVALDIAQEEGVPVQGLAVGELVLIDFDSANLGQFEIPFVESITDEILSINVGFPTVKTSGIAGNYKPNQFDEGWFVAVHPSELIDSILNLVTAKLDLSPELRAQFNLPSIADKTFVDAVTVIGEALLATIFDTLDGQTEQTPIFILDAKDETSNELIHGNFIPNSVIEDTLSADTANFGFYVAYAESNDIVQVNIDVDQTVAWVVNQIVKLILAAVSSGSAAQVLERIPTINPLDLSLGIDEILKIMEAPKEAADQIKKFFDLEIGFEAADLDVYSSLHFSQDFTLSIDDMSYLLTLEDGTQLAFAANQEGSIRIDDASSHDLNGDGTVSYKLQIVPTAMFSNDTELGLSIGYVLDFLQATLRADLKLPVGEVFGISALPSVTINMLDLHLGPLLRIQGDLDLASVDIFESRFDFNIGSATVQGGFAAAEPISLIGITSSGDQGLIV